jgi:cytochrome c-type biogenesis protein CcmH/NrfG
MGADGTSRTPHGKARFPCCCAGVPVAVVVVLIVLYVLYRRYQQHKEQQQRDEYARATPQVVTSNPLPHAHRKKRAH